MFHRSLTFVVAQIALMVLLFCVCRPAVHAQYIFTYAGGVTSGGTGDGGPATAGRMITPSGVCFDAARNLYVSDQNDCRIRRIDGTSNIISTVAGNGHVGYTGDNGPADSAELFYPEGVAVDRGGNIYMADQFNNAIRKVTDGVIYTIAGNGSIGDSGEGGPATAAVLYHPNDVTVDKWGTVYFVDEYNHKTKRIDTFGIITTIAGTGTPGYNGDSIAATTAELNWPAGIGIDTFGNVYIADYYNSRIRKVDMATGYIYTVAGSDSSGFWGDGGQATAAGLYDVTAVSVDKIGDIYIDDVYNYRIRKVDTAGIITTVAGTYSAGFSGDGGLATLAQLNFPQGVVGDDSGWVYIADYENGRVRIVKDGPVSVPTTILPPPSFVLSPNPTSGVITCRFDKRWLYSFVEVTNAIGAVCDTFQLTEPFYKKDLGYLPDGIYFLAVTKGTERIVKRVSILR